MRFQLIYWHSNTDSIEQTAINHNTRFNMIHLCASIKQCQNSSPPIFYHKITRRLLIPFLIYLVLHPTLLTLSSRFLPSAAHFEINDFRTSFPRISWCLKGRSHSRPIFSRSLSLFLSVVGSLLGFGWWFGLVASILLAPLAAGPIFSCSVRCLISAQI